MIDCTAQESILILYTILCTPFSSFDICLSSFSLQFLLSSSLIELEWPMPWSMRSCVMIDGGWKYRESRHVYHIHCLNSSCHDLDICIRLRVQ